MEEIDLEKYNFTYEIQYVQFMVELLKPYVEFEQFNTTESTVDIAGKSVLRRGLHIDLRKESGGKNPIDANQFIQFIQVDFPKIIEERRKMYNDEIEQEEKWRRTFQYVTRKPLERKKKAVKKKDRIIQEQNKKVVKVKKCGRWPAGISCPEDMDQNEYSEKCKYYIDTTDCEGNCCDNGKYTHYSLKLNSLILNLVNLDEINKVYWKRITTIDEVLRFLTNVKDHYIK